jgi:predicted Zn-dependent protease
MNANVLTSPVVRQSLLSAYEMRAESATRLKKYDRALLDLNKAYDLASPAEKPSILLSRAAALARTGKHAEAIADIAPLAGKAKAGASLYRLACVYALAAGAAKDSKNLSDEYAAEAMRLLNAAGDRKYFNSLKQQTMLAEDADLDALRNRPEFKKLLSEFKLQ